MASKFFKCAACGIFFATREAFTTHSCSKANTAQSTHAQPQETTKRNTAILCEECGGVFFTVASYNQHACALADVSSVDTDCTNAKSTDLNGSQHSPTENTKGISTTTGTCMSWNKSQTLLLISEYQRHEAKVTSGLLRKKMLWQKIETVFKEHGYSFTADQISGRWKTITRAFKNTKDHNKKSGNDKKHYEFEDALNDVLGDCPTVNPVTISSVKKRKLPDVDSESTEGEDDCSCSKSDSNESSKQKSKKTNSSEIINLLKQHSEQQREFQSEYRQMQAKESERRQKEHSERLLVLNSLIDAIKSNKK